MLRVSGACRSGEKANIGRLYQGLHQGLRVVKSFRYLLTDLCELNILLRCPGWWAIGCNSINNAVLEAVWVHDSSYACRTRGSGQLAPLSPRRRDFLVDQRSKERAGSKGSSRPCVLWNNGKALRHGAVPPRGSRPRSRHWEHSEITSWLSGDLLARVLTARASGVPLRTTMQRGSTRPRSSIGQGCCPTTAPPRSWTS